jgi:hypothetical protein
MMLRSAVLLSRNSRATEAAAIVCGLLSGCVSYCPLFLAALSLLATPLLAQEEDYKIFKDPPRLLLTSQRAKRLQRETTRDSIRWRQFHSLAESQADFPEPGFAWSLHFAAAGDAASAKNAIAWAMKPDSKDTRQLALVYDWCGKAMDPAEKAAIGGKLRKAIAGTPASQIDALLGQVYAAVALAEEAMADSEKVVKHTVVNWWRKDIAPALRDGKPAIRREDLPALFEIMHLIQDSTKIDLREDARPFFKNLPVWHMLSHYPAPLQTPENQYRIPVYTGGGEPDIGAAVLSRAVELMMVAYDNNAIENQFLQGYLIQDRFLLRSAYGIPYEFLWANPYQPGLPFEKMEPFLHDATGGRFFVRSNWEEDAVWFGFFDGKMQYFGPDGQIRQIRQDSLEKPIEIGGVTILLGREEMKIDLPASAATDGVHYFILGMPPRTAFDIETDDEEMYEAVSDASGILSLQITKGSHGRIWLHRPGLTVRP